MAASNRTTQNGTIVSLLLCALLAIADAPAHGESPESSGQKPSPEQRMLVAGYIAAVNMQSDAALMKLTSSASLACITDHTRPFFEYVSAKIFSHTIPDSAEVSITGVAPTDPLLMEDVLVYPVRPAAQVALHYRDQARDALGGMQIKDVSINFYAAVEGDHWVLLLQCPTEKALATMTNAKAK